MPQQLIYTSAPRGVVAGRSGHCTVARSAAMREALMLQLEKWSYYQHLSLSGGKERPIHCSRVMDLRGTRYHVLSHIQDAGLDFTGRTNFLAHHLVFTPEEIRRFPSPAAILRDWPGWVKSWTQEPQLLENEDWSSLLSLPKTISIPSTSWQQLSGDAINGYGLLEARTGSSFRVDNLTDQQILTLFGESLELFELRDPRRDFRASGWQFSFTTSMQEQDNPADFRWRCLHSDNPAANRFAGPDCRPLTDVRPARVTGEESTFARAGRQPPRFVAQPQNAHGTEGEPAKLSAHAEGVPAPAYQWFTVDRAGNGQIIPSGTAAELVIPNPPIGVSRYVVRASNSLGEVTSEVVTLSVDRKLRFSPRTAASVSSTPSAPASSTHVKSADDIDRQRRRIEAEKAEEQYQRKRQQSRTLTTVAIIFVLVTAVIVFWWKQQKPSPKPSEENSLPTNAVTATQTQPDDSATNHIVDAPTNAQSQITEENNTDATPSDRKNFSLGYKLPLGWTNIMIGTASNPKAEYINSRFDLSCNAKGFTEQGDNVLFAYTTVITREFWATLLKDVSPPNGGIYGIMLRESEKPDSQFLFIGATPTRIISYNRGWDRKFVSTATNIPLGNLTSSIFLKIQSDGKQFNTLYSFDDKKWRTNNLPATLNPTMAGMAVASVNLSNNVSAKFGGVQFDRAQ